MAYEYDGPDTDEQGRKIDWLSGNPIRKTDNSAKEGDFYPKDQVAKPLFLNPMGAPYAELDELGIAQRANGDRNDNR